MLQLNWNLLFTIINLIVFYLLIKKFLYGPIHNVMEQRKSMITDGLQKAQDTQNQANELKTQYETALAGAKSESENILVSARQDAKKEYDQIVQDAAHKTEKMMETARGEIQEERRRTMEELKTQIASVAMDAASNVIGKNADNFNNQDLYDQFLKEVGDADEKPDNE